MLNLDRTPWHMTWVGVRPQRARRRLDRARVSARTLPVERSWSFRRRAPRHRCQPCLRGSRLSSRVPPALSLSASRLSGTHSARTVRPTGTCRAPATNAAGWVWVPSAASTKRGWQAPLTSPFRHATRPSQARLVGAPGETRKRCRSQDRPLARRRGHLIPLGLPDNHLFSHFRSRKSVFRLHVEKCAKFTGREFSLG